MGTNEQKKPSNATVPLRNQFRGIDGWGPKKFKNSASGFLSLHTHICTQKNPRCEG